MLGPVLVLRIKWIKWKWLLLSWMLLMQCSGDEKRSVNTGDVSRSLAKEPAAAGAFCWGPELGFGRVVSGVGSFLEPSQSWWSILGLFSLRQC